MGGRFVVFHMSQNSTDGVRGSRRGEKDGGLRIQLAQQCLVLHSNIIVSPKDTPHYKLGTVYFSCHGISFSSQVFLRIYNETLFIPKGLLKHGVDGSDWDPEISTFDNIVYPRYHTFHFIQAGLVMAQEI